MSVVSTTHQFAPIKGGRRSWLQSLMVGIPQRYIVALGRALGQAAYYLDVPHRPVVRRNLEFCFPEWPLEQIRSCDRVVTVFEAMKAAARKSNVSLTFGLTVPVVHPLTSSLDMLTRYSFDLDEYRKKGTDYYLAAIDYREMQEKKNFSYQQATEAVSRVCRTMFSLAREGRRIIIILPMTERLTAKSLRHSEIEEMHALVRSVANMGVGFVIKSDTELDPQFTSRLFKK